MSFGCTENIHQNCINTALEKAEIICKEKSQKLTPLRKKILTMIWESHTPSKAYDLLYRLQQEDLSAKPPTIYRTLDFLQENNLIYKVHRLNAYIGSKYSDVYAPYFLLICTKCNEIKETTYPGYNTVLETITQNESFHVMHKILEMEGICHKCLNC